MGTSSTVDIGGVTYDIYGTETLADEYINAIIGSDADWTAADADDKKRALVSATRWLDRLSWQGTKTVLAQPLEWPRIGVVDRNGVAVDSATIPDEVENATYELAIDLVQDSTIQANQTTGNDKRRLKAGSAEIEFFAPTAGTLLPTTAHVLVAEFLEAAVSAAAGLASGTDQCTEIVPGQYDKSRGYP